jgi:hypothetical protein
MHDSPQYNFFNSTSFVWVAFFKYVIHLNYISVQICLLKDAYIFLIKSNSIFCILYNPNIVSHDDPLGLV